MGLTGDVIQRLLPRRVGQDVRVALCQCIPSGQPVRKAKIAQSAGVIEQIVDCDRVIPLRQLGQELANVIVQRQLALIC